MEPSLVFYTRAIIFQFALNMRVRKKNTALAISIVAPKMNMSVKSLSLPEMAPADGPPIRAPKLVQVKNIPIRVPIMDRLFGGVRFTMIDGGRLTNVPLKKPYRAAMAITPPLLLVAIVQ